jgi:hypothetical protein
MVKYVLILRTLRPELDVSWAYLSNYFYCSTLAFVAFILGLPSFVIVMSYYGHISHPAKAATAEAHHAERLVNPKVRAQIFGY